MITQALFCKWKPNENDMNTLLNKYFFAYIDRGFTQDETPLFTGIIDGKPLTDAVSQDFLELRRDEVAELIDFAKREVEL